MNVVEFSALLVGAMAGVLLVIDLVLEHFQNGKENECFGTDSETVQKNNVRESKRADSKRFSKMGSDGFGQRPGIGEVR
jgi:hypothetical protein